MVDAESDADGRPVAATLFGLNDCARTVVRDCEGHHAAHGMGIAVWQCTDTALEDLDLRDCRHPVNFEQHRGGCEVLELAELPSTVRAMI